MKSQIIFLQLCIVIASYVYCVLPPNLLEDHCYKLDAGESFVQKNVTPVSIKEIRFSKDQKLYKVGSYNFVAWQVTITAMAANKVNFRVWYSEKSSLLVSGKFAATEDALNFHREIYDDRMYNVPNQLQPQMEWFNLSKSLIESISVPFKLQKSNDIIAVATVPNRTKDSDPFSPPSVIAKPTEKVELMYESYKKNDAQIEKIFTITAADATKVRKPLVTFGPRGFQLVGRHLCADFIVISIFDVFYVLNVHSKTLASNLSDTFGEMTPYIIYRCPSEVEAHLDKLRQILAGSP